MGLDPGFANLTLISDELFTRVMPEVISTQLVTLSYIAHRQTSMYQAQASRIGEIWCDISLPHS
jgi:hypothetical protein